MQAAQFADQLVSGTQEQMIRVGQDDAGIQPASQIALRDALYGSLCAHWHEHGGFHHAMGGMQQSRPRACVRAFGLQLKMHSPTVATGVVVALPAGRGSVTPSKGPTFMSHTCGVGILITLVI